MEELVKVKNENGKQLVSARDLHNKLCVKRQFTDWWKQNSKDFIESTDYMFSPQSVNMPNGGIKQKSDYAITLDMAKELCMMSKTKKGKEIRQYFIKVEKSYKEMLANRKPDSYMIENPIERAKRWIEEREDYEKLQDKNAELQEKIDEDEDDVLFSHAIQYSHHAISIRELAAILTQNGFQIGQNQLYELLRLENFISKHSTLPLAQKMKLGYFRIRHGISRSTRHAYSTTLVTPKGQKNIISQALRGKYDDSYQKVVTNTFDI